MKAGIDSSDHMKAGVESLHFVVFQHDKVAVTAFHQILESKVLSLVIDPGLILLTKPGDSSLASGPVQVNSNLPGLSAF